MSEEQEPVIGNVSLVYEPSVEGIKRNLTDLNRQITEKKTAYDSFKTSISAKITQIRESITGLRDQLQKLNQEKKDIEGRIADLERRINESDGENVRLQQEIENLQKSRGEIDRDLQSINDQINQIRTIIVGLDPSADPNGNISEQLDDIISTLKGPNQGNGGINSTLNPNATPFEPRAGVRSLYPGDDQELGFENLNSNSNNYGSVGERRGERRGGRKYKNTKKGGRNHKSRIIKCRSKSRKQRGGFIALFKNKNQTKTSYTTSGRNKKNKSKRDNKKQKKTTNQANDPYNF